MSTGGMGGGPVSAALGPGGEVCNVRNYGAIGNGIADDTAAIQATINAAIASARGGTVFVPVGDYKITSTLLVDSAWGIKIVGAGMNTRLLWYGNATTPLFKLKDCRDSYVGYLFLLCMDVLLYGIQAYRSGASVTVVSGNNHFDHMWMQGVNGRLGTGLIFGGTGLYDANNDFNLVTHCTVANYSLAGYTVGHAQSFGNTFLNCRADGAGAATSDYGVDSEAYFQWLGGSMTSNGVDFWIHYGQYQPTLISYMQSEGSGRFIDQTNGDIGSLTIQNCRWSAGGIHADKEFIRWASPYTLEIKNCFFGDSVGGLAKIKWNPSSGVSGYLLMGPTFIFEGNMLRTSGTALADVFSGRLPTRMHGNRIMTNEGSNLMVPMPEYLSTFTASDTTPSVFRWQRWKTANLLATTITAFDDGWEGHEIQIVFGDALTTIQHGANLRLSGAVNWTPALYNTLRLIHDGTRWLETARCG